MYLAIQPLFTTDGLGDAKGSRIVGGPGAKAIAESVGGKGGFKSLKMGAVGLLKPVSGCGLSAVGGRSKLTRLCFCSCLRNIRRRGTGSLRRC